MTLKNAVKDVRGVGDEMTKKFKALGVETVGQLIDFYPRRYEDYSQVLPINRIKPGPVTIRATISQARGRYARRGMHITEAFASDKTSSVRLVWFNQPYRESSIKPGAEYYISGLFELSYQRFSIMNPSMELVSDFPVSTARIVPIYRETKGLTSKQIRRVLREVVPAIRKLPETLPAWLIKQQELMNRAAATEAMHFPKTTEDLESAKRRLGFEEVFELSLASLLNKQENQAEHSLKIPYDEELAVQFSETLPFKLTDAQRLTIMRVYKDLQKPQPMNRMVEGDVGSGKTVVATMAALMAVSQGYQTAFMAPTELLARQHADTIYQLLKPLGLEKSVVLLVGSLKPTEKAKAHKAIKSGQAKLIIGTHALIQEKVDMHNLALIIVDEQHRFGVEQRKALMAKAGHMPHVLSLTATPIPRSLALTLYGELDISVLDVKPANRKPIITKIVSPNSREQLYATIKKELKGGRQMFVVCPLITDSAISNANSAEKIYEQFSRRDFKEFKVGLLHGKMKADDKNSTMEKFLNRRLDILVATTVIEVGVDVPNASVMLIEAADRFGLAQIHQLRGRVGRSYAQGYCYLMMSDSSAPTRRLRALENTNDGFKLAELDMQLRGPGAIYGTLQHGALDLRVAQLSDTKLIASARQAAQEFIEKGENLLQYKELDKRVNDLRKITSLN